MFFFGGGGGKPPKPEKVKMPEMPQVQMPSAPPPPPPPPPPPTTSNIDASQAANDQKQQAARRKGVEVGCAPAEVLKKVTRRPAKRAVTGLAVGYELSRKGPKESPLIFANLEKPDELGRVSSFESPLHRSTGAPSSLACVAAATSSPYTCTCILLPPPPAHCSKLSPTA
jgi:hypothetical protein